MTTRVLISSFLEAEHVAAIAAVPGVEVLYEPELLPVPRYPVDHGGVAPEFGPGEQARWETFLGAAEVAFDFDWQAPAALPVRAPKLRWVQATSAGIGAFMRRTGLDRSGLLVTTAAGIHAVPLAEFALTGALHFVKDVPFLQEEQRGHRWERCTTRQLAGMRVTVVGVGGMGARVVRVFDALGAHVTAVGRPGGSYELPDGVAISDTSRLHEVLPRTEILVLCCALTEQTAELIGDAELRSLPRGAVLVNLARGGVVDEESLIEALRSRHLGGACLDVAAVEPLPEHSPLWDLPNVLISPHSASTVVTENAALTALFIDNLGRFHLGEPLRNRYDAERGY